MASLFTADYEPKAGEFPATFEAKLGLWCVFGGIVKDEV
jgi:hypothetical protein